MQGKTRNRPISCNIGQPADHISPAGLGCSARRQGWIPEWSREPRKLLGSQQRRHQLVHWILGFSGKISKSITLVDWAVQHTNRPPSYSSRSGLGKKAKRTKTAKIPCLSLLRRPHSKFLFSFFCATRLNVRHCTIIFFTGSKSCRPCSIMYYLGVPAKLPRNEKSRGSPGA